MIISRQIENEKQIVEIVNHWTDINSECLMPIYEYELTELDDSHKITEIVLDIIEQWEKDSEESVYLRSESAIRIEGFNESFRNGKEYIIEEC